MRCDCGIKDINSGSLKEIIKMCYSCGVKFLLLFFGGGIITIICLALHLFYQLDKDFADYDLLHGNFNLYNLLHNRKIKE